MEHHRSSEQQQPVFVTTSIGTHLAFTVLLSDTVSDLKRKVIVAHLSCFPCFGEIKIDAVKVKHKGCFYLLPDSILLPTLFKGKNDWLLYVDASTSAVYCEEIILQNRPFNCEAHVLQREFLMDARSADGASGDRKKLKLQESLKCHKEEEQALHQSTKGSGGHSREQTADLAELMTKEPDNKGIIIEKKVDKVLPVQEQVLIEAESGVQSGLQSSVDLALVLNHRRLNEDEANGRAEEDDVSRVSSATNMDQSRSSSKKRKKPSQKKESGKNEIVDKGEHGLEQVDGSQGAIPEAKPKEPANMETRAKQTTDNMALIEKQVVPVYVSDGSRVQNGISLLLGENSELSDRDVVNGRVEKGDIVPDSLAAGMLKNGSSRDKRKKSANKKDSSGKKTVVLTEEHVLKYVEGSPGTISVANPRETDNMESVAEEMIVTMAVVPEQGAVADTGHRGGIQHDPELVPDRDVANGRVEKGDIVPDSLATGIMKNGSSRDKRKKSANKKDSSRKKTVVLTEEHVLKYVEGSPGTISVANPRETDNKESVAEEIIVSMAVVPEQGTVAGSGHRGGIQHEPELVPEGINGQVNEKGVSVSAMSVDDMGENASVKKRKKSTQRNERSKKRNIIANEENLQKHVDDLWVVSSMGPRETHNKETGFAMSENVIQANEQALNFNAGDVSGVQNDPEQVENNEEFIDDEAIRGAMRVVSHDPFFIGVMEDKSSTKNRKKSTRTKESSKKKALDPDEKHVLRQDPFDKHGPKHVEGPKGVSSLPKPKESDKSGKSIEEKLDDTVIVHEQALRADTDYGSEVQNGPALLLQGENNSQFLGDGAIVGTEKGRIANDLLASGVVVDKSSKKKTKKSANKPSKKKTVYPEEKLVLKQDPKEKLVLMLVEDSVGANSLDETKEGDNKETSIEEKSADVVAVHEKTFDDNAGYGVQEENNELLLGDEAIDEAKKVNLSPDLLASGVMEDETSKKKTKKSTNKQSKKKTVHLEEKLASKQDPKDKLFPHHVEDSTGANSLTKAIEADNKENSADVVVVHEQICDTDAGDRLQEENNEQFHGDEATGEVEKVNLAPDLLVSGMVKDASSPTKKKPTQKNNATSKKIIDSHEDHKLETIESSPGASFLARSTELVNSKNNFSQAEGNESVTPVSYVKTADELSAEVNLQETLKRKGMTGAVQEAQRKRKKKLIATDKSVEQDGDINASSEMTKKECQKVISTSSVSKSDNLLSSASSFHASDGKLEESGSIKFSDYFSPGGPQVTGAASADTNEVADMKRNGKINPPNFRKNRDSEASASAIEVTKNNKKKHSNLDRYCVAFRNSSHQSLQASVEGQKRSLLDKSGSIFEDESSGGPDDDQGSGKSDATTRAPSDDSVSSDYSDGDSNALMKSRENGNSSHQNGRPSNMQNLLLSGGNVELTKILQRSSRYKKAKKAASQSQEKDMDSEPVDFVPDSQADV